MLTLFSDIAQLLKMTYTELSKIDRKTGYKPLIKRLKKLMKTTHPDAGGDADKFREVQVLYEDLLQLEKKDADCSSLFRILDMISRSASKLDATGSRLDEFSNEYEKSYIYNNLDEILGNSPVIEIPRNRQFQVGLDELVTHFNTLKYCSITVMNCQGEGRAYAQVTIDSDQDPQPFTTQLWSAYKQAGKYEMHFSAHCTRGEKLKLTVKGFDDMQEVVADTTKILVLTFEQNNVYLKFVLNLYVT